MVNTFAVFDVGAEKRFIRYTAWPFDPFFKHPATSSRSACSRSNCEICVFLADWRYERATLDRWADDGGRV